MINRWNDAAAAEAIERWQTRYGRDLALRCYTARLIGQDPDLVLHGGGNVSMKGTFRSILGEDIPAIFVKGSGWDMSNIEPPGLPALRLEPLRHLRALTSLDHDGELANQLRIQLFDAAAPTPSIETLMHAFIPLRFIDHSHADALLVLTNQPNGDVLVREALGSRVSILPYVTPGFELAKAVADLYDANPKVEGIVLLQHGLVTFSDDARSAYDRHIKLVQDCESFITKRTAGKKLQVSFRTKESAERLATIAAPLLRGILAHGSEDEDDPWVRSIGDWRATPAILDFVNSAEASELSPTGPLTTDHLIRTKAQPLLVENPAWDDPAALRSQIQSAVDSYRALYLAYVSEHGINIDTVDPSPRVVLLPGAGAFCWGATRKAARIAADITEHALAAKTRAHFLGRYTALADEHLFVMEFRAMQTAKLDPSAARPLERKVVIISGGAGAIGAAIAETCAAAGAHVVIADLDDARLKIVVDRVERRSGRGVIIPVVMNVTDEDSVKRGFERACLEFGGVDVVVPNAGIAHVASLDQLNVADFRRVMEINSTGYLLFMREGARLLKTQGLGGHIVVISSKNVFGPGKDFGAYSASKAAGHQLGRVAAIELAPFGIRVNMINPDAIFGDKAISSGLWDMVGPERAKSRGMKLEDLPDYYKDRNLLKTRVYGHHVGNAVVFFASNATPTTGASLPVDGGVVEAFPR